MAQLTLLYIRNERQVLVPIKAIIGKVVINNSDQLKSYLPLLVEWDKVVGEEIGRHTTIIGFARGILKVAVDSATWATELSGMKNQLLRKIQADLREFPISEILFSVSQLPEGPDERESPMHQDRELSILSEVELDEIRESTRTIKNESLRNLTIRVTALNCEINKSRQP